MNKLITHQAGSWWLCDCNCHQLADKLFSQQSACRCCSQCPECKLCIVGNFQMHLDECHARVASS